jgi:alpha-tubulin suppressor-like RCC1 family protein
MGNTQRTTPHHQQEITIIHEEETNQLHCIPQATTAVYTFGNNYSKQTSRSKEFFTREPTPIQLDTIECSEFCSRITSISCGTHRIMIVLDDKLVYVTGHNGLTLLEDWSLNKQIRMIKAGYDCEFIVYQDGTIHVNGANVPFNRLCIEKDSRSIINGILSLPENVAGRTVTHIVIGVTFSMIVFDQCEVYASGLSLYGECGFYKLSCFWNNVLEQLEPPKQSGSSKTKPNKFKQRVEKYKIKYLEAGSYHTIWVLGDESVWVSGRNNKGQLALSTTKFPNVLEPHLCLIHKYITYKTVTHLACGSEFTVIVFDHRNCYAFGAISPLEKCSSPTPVQIPLNSTEIISKLCCGHTHCIISTSKYCCIFINMY